MLPHPAPGHAALELILCDLATLHDEVPILLEKPCRCYMSTNESENDSSSRIQIPTLNLFLEPGLRNSRGSKRELVKAKAEDTTKAYPLGLVTKARPEITDYAASVISNWRGLMNTTA
jgi:replication initiation protein RepC